jgi:tetratricopeptide (TPR) repeat protein
LLPITAVPAQQGSQAQAFAHILNLQFNEARAAAQKLPLLPSIYYSSLADMVELLVLEKPALFAAYETQWESRLNKLSTATPSAEKYYTLAELRLQWAVINLKFGHELQAAWQLRQSYLAAQACRQQHPHYEPIRKTWGILNIMLGTVPDKYQWVLRMLNLRGSVEGGLLELNRVSRTAQVHGAEARILLALSQSYLLQQNETALALLEEMAQTHPAQLVWFLASAIALKSGQAGKAQTFLDSLIRPAQPCPIPYAHYLRGEALLASGNYNQAIQAYRQFIADYDGENFVKDAWYKTGVCYALANDSLQAEACFGKAKKEGTNRTEADRYAQAQLNDSPWPHPVIAKLRYATDGGYYQQALKLAQQHARDSFPSKKDSVEFLYRTARLYHKLAYTDTCLVLYQQTIESAGPHAWYFAPNACLQTGYILKQRGDYAEAEKYFRKALTYSGHPYKNSIDSKAQAALASLKKK